MPYATYTLAQIQQEVANALNDPSMVFWPQAEITVHVANSLRFWNALTGDNKTWYVLVATGLPTVWYDLQALAGSPRQSTLKDTDLYSWLQYALVEAQSPANAGMSSGQYSTDQMVQSLQRARDEFLFRTGATSTAYSVPVIPNVATLAVRETVIDVRRGYWLPALTGGAYPKGVNPFPLFRSDEYGLAAYARQFANSPGNPRAFSPGIEPPLTVDLYPAPGFPGTVEFLTVESQAALSNPPPPGTVLYVPSDFAPALYWRTLADLLEMNAECRDPERAAYARARFEQHVEMARAYPFVLAARSAGLPLIADAVENVDRYAPLWERQDTGPVVPKILPYSGQNLVAFPGANGAEVALYVVANAVIPSAGQYVQLGREVLDAVIGYAAHTALFKCGWAEVASSMVQLKAIVQLAAERNAKVRAMSTFRELLYGKATREDEESAAPRERALSEE
jgi:hypothetical protein